MGGGVAIGRQQSPDLSPKNDVRRNGAVVSQQGEEGGGGRDSFAPPHSHSILKERRRDWLMNFCTILVLFVGHEGIFRRQDKSEGF